MKIPLSTKTGVEPKLIVAQRGKKCDNKSMKRYELTKEQEEQKPLLPLDDTGTRGRPRKDNRAMLNGMLWNVRSGTQWRELPETYGLWQSVQITVCYVSFMVVPGLERHEGLF